jgi:hypothetical protein
MAPCITYHIFTPDESVNSDKIIIEIMEEMPKIAFLAGGIRA